MVLKRLLVAIQRNQCRALSLVVVLDEVVPDRGGDGVA
jgi:hypothetical protein